MANDTFVCSMCVYSTRQFSSFRKHFVRSHKNDPNFYIACCIGACGYTTRNWPNYRVHVHRKHRNVDDQEYIDHDAEVDCEHSDEDDALPAPTVDISHFNAMFSLCLETRHNISQTGIDNIVCTANSLVQRHLEHYTNQIKSKLESVGINPEVVDDIRIDTDLEQFATHSRRKHFYNKNLETLVKPQQVIVGEKYITKQGSIKKINTFGYIVPFEQSLHQLLQLPEVWEHIQHSHSSQDGFMRDICDGDFIANHPLFVNNSTSLQIAVNCDDLEIVNPLGCHIKKHKITIFYYTLCNIPPEHRSRLQAIQLLAICKTKEARNQDSEEKLLSDFIDAVLRLEQNGIEFEVNGIKQTVKGTLVICAADTLAANWIGKFKEGVSFALKNCRRCEVENTKTKHVFSERQVVLRSNATHNQRCDDLTQMSKQTRVYWSKLWGINGKSPLLKIEGFDLSGLVQDPIHVLW